MIIGKETARANGHISLQLQMNERERGEIKVRHLRISLQVNFSCQFLTSTLIQGSIHFRHQLSNSHLRRVIKGPVIRLRVGWGWKILGDNIVCRGSGGGSVVANRV